MSLPPISFAPILKPKVWGGRRLARFGKTLPADTPIGESWELSDLPPEIPDGRSIVADGPLAGRTLRELIEEHGDELLGAARPASDGGFPLLVKLLDANENLSVQVHPSVEYAAAHPEAHLKSEAWVILEAEPHALLYVGLRPGLDRGAVIRHIRTGEIVDDLVAVPARAGDCHYLPSGTCHALGAGILVAEVQTPSDTTFRLYDWGREGRTLHVEEALACIDLDQAPPRTRPETPLEIDGIRTTPLVGTPHFTIERLELATGAICPIRTSRLPEVWMGTDGLGVVAGGGRRREVGRGTTVLLPARIEDASVRTEQGATFLRVCLPAPIEGLLA